jgi:hypothetical protein
LAQLTPTLNNKIANNTTSGRGARAPHNKSKETGELPEEEVLLPERLVALMKLTKEERMMFSTRWRGTGLGDMITTATSALTSREPRAPAAAASNTANTGAQRTTCGRHSQDKRQATPFSRQTATQHNNKRARAPHKKKQGNRGTTSRKREAQRLKIETLKQD